MNLQVEKRNGDIVQFELEKIENAIKKAMAETEQGVDEEIAKLIANETYEHYKVLDIVDIERIQDFVEIKLMAHRPETAKKYILYREKRSKLREHGWEMSDLQRDIYEQKYRFEDESFEDFLDRVSDGNNYIKKSIADKEFMPAGRILAGRGLDKLGRKITLSNCYVMPKVEDSIESIFDTAKQMARTYSYGGGVGLTISNLRPRGAKVNNAALTTTGAVSFMDLYSMVTGLIGMKGRRGALMLNMDVDHPDIEEFIDVKNDLDKVNFANISVNIDDNFMEAVKHDRNYRLHFEVDASGEVIEKEIRAEKLFKKIAENNWNMAEPGILFTDRINTWHLLSEDEDFEFAGVNPCAEETLPAFGSCNLSSINLSSFVKNPFEEDAYFDFEEFEQMVKEGVIYLNQILDENMELHPLQEQRDMSRKYRQIGLGVMGIADMFIKLGIKYGSEESINFIDNIGPVLVNGALQQSALLAKEYGTFPAYKEKVILASPYFKANANDKTVELVKKYGLRNSQLLTIPPTGSTSTLIGCSNGIEPIFQISYTRKSDSLHTGETYYKVYTEIVKEYMEFKGIKDEENLPEFFITTANLDYKNRIDLQATWQKYIDASISSTVNVPNEFTIEEVEHLYYYAWEKGVKGVTIYRDGCARGAVLITDKDKNVSKIQELQTKLDELILQELLTNPDVCPMCEGTMIHSGGCDECQDCGYSPCSI